MTLSVCVVNSRDSVVTSYDVPSTERCLDLFGGCSCAPADADKGGRGVPCPIAVSYEPQSRLRDRTRSLSGHPSIGFAHAERFKVGKCRPKSDRPDNGSVPESRTIAHYVDPGPRP